MSEDLTDFTPPVTPPLGEYDKFFDDEDVSFVGEEDFLRRFSFRWFACSGEARLELKLNENSIVNAGEEFLFSPHEDEKLLLKKNDRKSVIQLFGFNFDKGSALLCNTELLFKFARCELMNIDSVANTYGKFGIKQQGKDPAESRKYLVRFFLYIREYLYYLLYSNVEQYCDILKHLNQILSIKLYSFRCLMRRVIDLPEYICQHAAAVSQGSMATSSGYHVFHSHLDLSWFHLTSVIMLNNNNLKNEVENNSDQLCGLEADINNQFVGFSYVQFSINYLICEYIQLAIFRFEKVGLKDILKCSPFNCTCVRELWLLIQLLLDYREKELNLEGFWSTVNNVLNIVLGVENTGIAVKEMGVLKIPDCLPCSNPSLFVIWILNHLSPLYRYNNREMKSNYKLLESILKEVLKTDVAESLLQLYIPLVRTICLDQWELRSEPIIILWDYFQRRLNNSFYLPGSSLDKMAIISKSSVGLISQVESRLNGHKQENSFGQFLQLLGLFLKQCEDNPKHWNQLKGRIYSKFPASKMLGLNETGLYHFISLFITMAMARKDVTEVCKKLQEFLQFIEEDQLDADRQRLIWQTHLAVLLLLSERQLDFTQSLSPLLNSVQKLDYENNPNLMKMFVEGFQDIIDSNNSINLGQANFIDDWISKYLAICSEADATVLVNTLLVIIKRLKMKQQSLESQELELFEKLWFHMKRYIENLGNTSKEYPLQIADIAADLAILSIKVSHTALRFREMVNVFTANEIIDIRLLRRFICQLIQYKPLKMALPDHNNFVVKLWIRCSVLSVDTDHAELKELEQYVMAFPEIKAIQTEEITSEPIIHFFIMLRNKYDNLQNIVEKGELRDVVVRYFDGMKQWLQLQIKTPNCPALLNRIYYIIGHMVIHIGPLIYVKSHPMTILQMVIDVLLLPISVRKPEYKLHPAINSAIRSTLHLYIEGLVKLGVDHDKYITRITQELIVLYLPRCIPLPGDHSLNSRTFPLVNCFNETNRNSVVAKFILDTIKMNFFKPRVRSPLPSCRQALQFIKDILLVHGCSKHILLLITANCLENICCIIMYCEDRNLCKKDANDIVLQILDSQPVRQDDVLGKELMGVFSRLCKEHLAFSSRQLFNLFMTMSTTGPDLILRFLPILFNHIREVESKRALGYDRALRAEYEKLEKNLNYLQS